MTNVHPLPPSGRAPGNLATAASGELSADQIVAELRPQNPLYIVRPQRLREAADRFLSLFPGETMYAVKSNPDPLVLQTLYASGVRSFDVASIGEVRLVRGLLPEAKLYFMHPVKSRAAIREAYEQHGVRAFVLDSEDELRKIVEETRLASDLEMFVRLALPKNEQAATDFSSKFGALPADAAMLLKKARPSAARLGIAFHTGTQNMSPAIYTNALNVAAQVIRESGVRVDMVDCGGGFPAAYTGMVPPPLADYMAAITEGRRANGLEDLHFLCEPGRGLSAECSSLVVRVEVKRGNTLYITDGTYGGLFEGGPLMGLRFPARLIRLDGECAREQAPFRLAGPTCDSLDLMEGPYELPSDVHEGDWLELSCTGVYSAAQRCGFNGLGDADVVIVDEAAQDVKNVA